MITLKGKEANERMRGEDARSHKRCFGTRKKHEKYIINHRSTKRN